jgi:protein SCO1
VNRAVPDARTRWLWLVAAVLGLTTLLVLLLWRPPATSHDGHAELPLAAAPTGGDFTLSGHGGAFDFASLRGEAVLLYFGYSWCPDVCPTSLATIGMALDELTETERSRTRGLFVSVDPERDTVERLAEYAAFFHERLQGVSGTAEELAEAGRLYGAAWYRAEGGSATAYLIDHSSATYLVAPDGTLAATYPHGTPASALATGVREALSATPAAEPPTAAQRVRVHEPFVRLTPPGQPNSAAFMGLENTGESAVRVVAAESPAAEVVELHTHLQEDGIMRMRQVDAIDLPAGARTELAPGGLHVMLIGLVEALAPESMVAVTLVFDDGSRLELQAPTRHPRDMPARAPMGPRSQ